MFIQFLNRHQEYYILATRNQRGFPDCLDHFAVHCETGRTNKTFNPDGEYAVGQFYARVWRKFVTVDEAQVLSAQIAQSSLNVAIIQTIVAIFTLVASVAVSVILYLGTRRIAIAEYRRSMRDGWASVNATALGDEQTLKIADLLLEPSLETIPIEERRRKWFSYMLLNPLATTYYGIQNGYVEPGTLARVERMVSVLMQNDEVYELIQRDIFEPEFTAFCRFLRDKPCHLQSKPSSP